MGNAYALVNKAKTKFPQSRLVLRGILSHRDVSWQRIGALNGRYDWIVKTMGITFVDQDSWIENWDFDRDGQQINQSGARRLCQLEFVASAEEDRIRRSDCCSALTLRDRLKGCGR
jgi:hypothetical protein